MNKLTYFFYELLYSGELQLYVLQTLLLLIYAWRAAVLLRALISGKEEQAIPGLKKLDEESIKGYDIKKAVKIQCVLYVVCAVFFLSLILYAVISHVSSSRYLQILLIAQLTFIVLISPLALYLSKKPSNLS